MACTSSPATQEAEAEELLELGRPRLHWAEITPLHSSSKKKSNETHPASCVNHIRILHLGFRNCLLRTFVLLIRNAPYRPGTVAHACNPSTLEAKAGGSPEVGSPRPAWPTRWNPVLKKKKEIGTRLHCWWECKLVQRFYTVGGSVN